jgi:cytochrome c heme-lyase
MSASNTSKPSLPSTTRQKPAECPIDHSDDSINPLNQMPRLSQSRLSDAQLAALGTDREISTIPRTLSSTDDPTIPSSSQNWIYPSEQQFYNALVRKGWETPEEEVESMVFIHNHLNEVAWREVLEWEKRRPDHHVGDAELAKFKGRPGELSPRAKMHLWMASIWPDAYR